MVEGVVLEMTGKLVNRLCEIQSREKHTERTNHFLVPRPNDIQHGKESNRWIPARLELLPR